MKFIKKLRVGSFVLGGFIALISLLHAQETPTLTQDGGDLLTSTNDVSALSDLEVEMKAIETATPTPAADLPQLGTFWSAQHAPDSTNEWPPLPENVGNVPAWDLGNGVFLLSDLDYDYDAAAQSESLSSVGGVRTMSLRLGGGGFGESFSAMLSIADFSTNLWLEITNLTASTAGLLLSNTEADIQYEIQGVTNLTDTNWVSEGFVLGSELTNWTPTSVAATNYPNLFLRVRSWADDGSGLPIWWQLQYFGTTGVDPNADPEGDGWSNIHKFQNGMNPNVFYTPPAPQGLTVTFNSSNGVVNVSWQSSPGTVTGYTVTKVNDNTGETTNFNLSASASSLADTVTGNGDEFVVFDVDFGPLLDVQYQVQAHYGTSGDSAWSNPVLLEPNYNTSPDDSDALLPVSLVAGSHGSAYLAASALPLGTVTLRVKRVDEYAEDFFGDASFDTYFDIPVSAFTNGLYLLPASMTTAAIDTHGQAEYAWYVQTVDANNNPSEPKALSGGFNGPNYYDEISYDQSWIVPPYFDGRAQLKQNLIFLLRAAAVDFPFAYTEVDTVTTSLSTIANPTGYEYAGFYRLDETASGNLFDPYWPFENNYRYHNFVFNSSDLDGTGFITTGAGGNYAGNTVPGFEPFAGGLYLLSPPTYQLQAPATNDDVIPAVLATNDTRWLAAYAIESPLSYLDEIGLSYSSPNFQLATGVRNLFGLPFLSVKVANSAGNITLSAGDSTTNNGYLYPETTQPQFQTAEYDFWRSSPLPGASNFSTSQTNDLLIATVGKSIGVNGYAKLSVQNGYSGVYGYLGQYFDQAYQIDSNGVITTNTTGVLSSYGNFFPTQPGPVALVTAPDIDTGERGTATVYAVSLQLDANHDGNMDLSFGGADATSPSQPFVFWCNNNFDRWDNDFPFDTPEQDDMESGGDLHTPNATVPDCNYLDVGSNRIIPDTRDLEDFSRLWINGVTSNLLASLPAGSTVTLSWGDIDSPNSSNPTIDLFQAADTDGGIGYLTNETTAAEQIDPAQAGYIGRIAPGQGVQLNANFFGSTWRGNNFIWCGVANGNGQLSLTFKDGSGNVFGQASVYIQIKDIKQMFERWTVGDVPSVAPATTAYLSQNGLVGSQTAFQYGAATTNTPYILLVHGYNMQIWEKDTFAEAAFKRLYWQGYQGRFGAFNWPTAEHAAQFGSSELEAWNSAQGLLNKLNDLNADYPSHVYLAAHSLGNVVAGEALRLASSQVVNAYVAMQGAVSAHAYDPTTTAYSLTEDWGAPDRYAQYYTNGAPCYFNTSAGAGTYVNFFNTNDWALRLAWLAFQNSKPILDLNYSFTPPDSYFKNSGSTELFFPANTYELFDKIIQSRSYALGMQPNVNGSFQKSGIPQQIDLQSVWPPDTSGNNYGDHIWHSAEFRSDNPQRWLFWDTMLLQMGLKNHL